MSHCGVNRYNNHTSIREKARGAIVSAEDIGDLLFSSRVNQSQSLT